MRKIIILLSVPFFLSAPLLLSQEDILKQMNREADSIQTNNPDLWKQYKVKVDSVLFEYNSATSNWMLEAPPPPPNLKPLGLPLSFLVLEYQRPGGDRYLEPYLSAIAGSSDLRRIRVLLALHNQLWPNLQHYETWIYLIAEASTLEWAITEITKLLEGNSSFSGLAKTHKVGIPSKLLTHLLGRYAEKLPDKIRIDAYKYIRAYWKEGPSNGDAEKYWHLLMRLDPEYARKEIIGYYGKLGLDKTPLDHYVVNVLNDHAGPSKLVAEAAKKWLGTGIDDSTNWSQRYHNNNLRLLLLKSDPEHETKHTLRYIYQLVNEIKAKLPEEKKKNPYWHDDPERLLPLVGTIVELDRREVADELAELCGETVVDKLARMDVVVWLAGFRYPCTAQLLARWIREEDSYCKSWPLDKIRQKSPEYAAELEKEAKQINDELKH